MKFCEGPPRPVIIWASEEIASGLFQLSVWAGSITHQERSAKHHYDRRGGYKVDGVLITSVLGGRAFMEANRFLMNFIN